MLVKVQEARATGATWPNLRLQISGSSFLTYRLERIRLVLRFLKRGVDPHLPQPAGGSQRTPRLAIW